MREMRIGIATFGVSHPESAFCKDCTDEILKIIRTKYSTIEAAHFRAKLRRRSREAMDELRRKML